MTERRRQSRTELTGVSALLAASLRWLASLGLGIVLIPAAAGLAAAATFFRADLPGELPDERPAITAEPSIVYDRDGHAIGLFRGFDRTVEVNPSQIPEILKQAVVAIEDQRFYQHNGVDLEGIARAARVNLELGEVAQGGSTITQQYVKNVYLSKEQTFERKFREALLAIELEQELTKDEILFRYLETSYFGSGAYGVGAAAEVYFGKPVSELDISEAATLAGVVQAPTRLSPRENLQAAEERRVLVLQEMLGQGYITPAEFDAESVRHLWIAGSTRRPGGTVTVIVPPPVKGASDHPFFVDWVEAELLERLGPDQLYRQGLTIETTIDPSLQAVAEQAAAERLATTEYPVDMAMVTLDPRTGEVLAMVGGRDYDFSKVNLAIGGSTGFQPGSSFKPIVLAEAFSRGIGPDTVYPAPATWTVPACVGSQCTISNYDNRDRGDLTLRDATKASVNTVFAELIHDVSVQDTIALATELGMSRFDPDGGYGVSVALGAVETSPLEMASVYGTFANRGVRVPPVGIRRVVDRDGNVLIDNTLATGTRVLDTNVADHVTDVLRSVVDDGTGQRARVPGYDIAGKTGTAQEYRAAWFVGYTPSVVTAVWMGHADALASLRKVNGVARVTGGSHPAMAFSQVMRAALAGTVPEHFPVPADLPEAPENADEVVRRRQEETVAGPRRLPFSLDPDCDGPCLIDGRPEPALTPQPAALAPTTAPADPTTSTGGSSTSTSSPPTTGGAPVPGDTP